MKVVHRSPIVPFIVLVLTLQGCGALATYGQDRARDLSDVIDVRYGTGFGLGAHVEVLWLETGLGCSTEWYYRQWFGRKSVEVRDGLFGHGIIFGVDGEAFKMIGSDSRSDSSTSSFDFLVFDLSDSHGHSPFTGNEEWFGQPAGNVPVLERFRLGGVVFLPGVSGGLYLNGGEIADFLCGIVGYDLMRDDGTPKFHVAQAADVDAMARER